MLKRNVASELDEFLVKKSVNFTITVPDVEKLKLLSLFLLSEQLHNMCISFKNCLYIHFLINSHNCFGNLNFPVFPNSGAARIWLTPTSPQISFVESYLQDLTYLSLPLYTDQTIFLIMIQLECVLNCLLEVQKLCYE